MKKFFLFVLVSLSALYSGCSKGDAEEYAMITFVIGDVMKNSTPVQISDLVKEKDLIETMKDSFCDIKIGTSIIRIKEKSKVVVSSLLKSGDIENTALGLDVGKMLCKPKKLLKSESFLIKTPTAVAGVRGTNFTIEADQAKTTRIKVFEGEVKIARRVKQLDNVSEKVLEAAPKVTKEEKVVITQKEVEKAEKAVEEVLKKEKVAPATEDAMIKVVMAKAKDDVVLSAKSIEKFEAGDFQKEKKEMIEVREKPREEIVQIVNALKREKDLPKPEGRLLITRFEIYFIKDGKIQWEGEIVGAPATREDKIFIASGNYVFCASTDGPVFWRKNIKNDGRVEIRGDRLIVLSEGKEIALNPDTGE